jgi:hypothetical protein
VGLARAGPRYHELHHLAGGAGVGGIEIDAGNAAAEGLVRADVEQCDLGPVGQASEVHNDIRPLSQGHEELGRPVPTLVEIQAVHQYGRGQKALLGADLPHLDGRII